MGAISKTLFFLIFTLQPLAQAYELEDEPGYFSPEDRSLPSETLAPLSPGERMRKLGLALDALKIPAESAPSFGEFPTSGSLALPNLQEHLPYFDPDSGIQRYLTLDTYGASLFRDHASPNLPGSFFEYFYSFRPLGPAEDSPALLERLRATARRVQNGKQKQPLLGLKIVIDPGHMGTPDWDRITGKYVAAQKRKVSEGNIALLTSLLLAERLESLGAEITLTRTSNGTVATSTPETFDPTPHRNQYFYNSVDSWMSPLFALGDASFVQAIRNAPETEKAYTEAQKTQFFISGEDLEARSRIIDSVRPDLVLDIHYDARDNTRLQNSDSTIEAFVPGGVRASETGSRVMRGYHLKHLLEVRRWNESVNLASHIIQSMSQTLGVPLLTQDEFLTSIKVKDGVYARNLYINRRNLGALMVYLECLHYDHVNEFPLLANARVPGSYRGIRFRYPHRIQTVVDGIVSGLLRYFQELQ